ncbi:Exo-beta-1,3-glucanase [Methyloglobulus morosus KoM1]|uniref:Endo-1,3-beta-glucanase btgC n=1 Tax=Methyloglobulus morosus KoM1 TaxID=1116472 RepID=V5BUE7_9GAMM|nr:exo-beta-1,3-glucanase [Methyloglobulus morosus]ESS71499.1 Exo-beta-1,3-glucanase [Methyloglobulus morosus KoM1]
MRIISFAAFIILLNGLFCYLANLPEDIGLDVLDGKLNSLSYAPFREGQSPLLAIFPDPGQIDEDLKLLSEKTHTFRTYSSTEGMDVVPPLARKYGLKMIQGAWIGYVDTGNQKEIDELVKAANAYPDVIKRVIVGNEVLLRGEREPEELVNYIRQVKSRIKQPVSYADVWSMYMKYPDLIKEVDFITIHILPYWEDEPIPVEKAPAHIERIYKQVQQEAERIAPPGKPILIGESGWPSEGKQRGWAVPSVVNEAAFIRGLLKVAADNHFDVNIVESFNQPWKSELEGVVGANWGLFSADRNEVFPLTGKVTENVKWVDHFLITSLIMVLMTVCYAKKLQNAAVPKLLVFLVLIQVLSALLVFHADKSWYTSYSDWQRLRTVLIVLLNLAVALLVIHRSSNLLVGERTNRTVIVALDAFYFMVIALMLYKTYLLAVDGRYISFPFEIAAIPTIALLGLFVINCLHDRFILANLDFNQLIGRNPETNRRNQQLGWLTLFYAVGLIVGEAKAFMMGRDFILAYPGVSQRLGCSIALTLGNLQLLGWLTCLLYIALTLLVKSDKLNVSTADK